MKRVAHVIQVNKVTRFPSHFLFFDVESNQVKITKDKTLHTFKMCSSIYWRPANKRDNEVVQKKVFYDSQEFLKYVESKVYRKKPLTLIANNIDFDWTVGKGFTYIKEHNWKITSIVSKDKPYLIHLKKKTLSITILDLFNYFNTSVEKLGSSINLPKLEIDFKHCTEKELEIYNMRDTEIIYKFFRTYLNFLVENDLGNFKYTISSQAFTTYRHRFMPHKIYIHNRADTLKVEREAYHGGRTEAFYIGKIRSKPLYKLDVNSMYGYAMLNNKSPVKLIMTLNRPTLASVEKSLENHSVIGKFICEVKEPIFPYLINGKQCYPVGEGEFALSTPEIKYALDKGYIKSCSVLYIYEEEYIFTDYVDFFYNLKEKSKRDGNDAWTYMSKQFLNSLYGKFGQRSHSWEKINLVRPYGFYVEKNFASSPEKVQDIRVIGERVEIEQLQGEWYNSFPAIAAHVSAYARMYLWFLIQKVGLENVYYCDTDSIFTNEQGYNKVQDYIDKFELGKLKIEGRANYFDIRSSKDYTFGKITRIKGINKNAKKISKNIYKCERWWHFEGRLRKGDIESYITETYIKHLKRVYDKGTISEIGQVIPFNLQDLERIEAEKDFIKSSKALEVDLREKFKNIILAAGGVNDSDYEDYPRWCKRKKGKTLDVLIDRLIINGYPVNGTDDVYKLLWLYK